ncbi:uncharacterized mitochondrial protein AtMg00810-like [Stegodyphus dumicola]|uniref:uncharacterized mitochondrial protein AtMg00810-like n=1 Tax=Stegodyphus dumicola TaxID=202533 RepID=UPI0015AF6445|nr:uncharacterized mitochondrial protein AtMg00810-like [Stegodyphus dumicola]
MENSHILYVDDILIGSEREEDAMKTVQQLKAKLEIKYLGEVTYYLGIYIERSKDGTFAPNQKNKIEEIFQRFGFQAENQLYTPMETNYCKLENEADLLKANAEYRQAVRALLYITTISRPDIACTINLLSSRNEKRRKIDCNAVKKVIRYLKNN